MFPLRSCLVDAGRTLLFVVEQVFLLMGEVWLMPEAGTKCTVEGRGGGQRAENIFSCLNFSYLAIKYEFYFTLSFHLKIFRNVSLKYGDVKKINIMP